MIIDKKPKKVLLTSDEINIIKDSLEYQSYSIFTFFNCDKIIKKLNNALKGK